MLEGTNGLTMKAGGKGMEKRLGVKKVQGATEGWVGKVPADAQRVRAEAAGGETVENKRQLGAGLEGKAAAG